MATLAAEGRLVSVYRVQVEVLPMEGATLPSDWAGAFVNVYVGACNIIEAISKAEEQLFSDLYKPDNTYSAYEIDIDNLQELETDDDDGISAENIRSLDIDGGLLYGAFHGFPPEQDDIH